MRSSSAWSSAALGSSSTRRSVAPSRVTSTASTRSVERRTRLTWRSSTSREARHHHEAELARALREQPRRRVQHLAADRRPRRARRARASRRCPRRRGPSSRRTKKRRPSSVGKRPAEAWDFATSPSSASSREGAPHRGRRPRDREELRDGLGRDGLRVADPGADHGAQHVRLAGREHEPRLVGVRFPVLPAHPKTSDASRDPRAHSKTRVKSKTPRVFTGPARKGQTGAERPHPPPRRRPSPRRRAKTLENPESTEEVPDRRGRQTKCSKTESASRRPAGVSARSPASLSASRPPAQSASIALAPERARRRAELPGEARPPRDRAACGARGRPPRRARRARRAPRPRARGRRPSRRPRGSAASSRRFARRTPKGAPGAGGSVDQAPEAEAEHRRGAASSARCAPPRSPAARSSRSRSRSSPAASSRSATRSIIAAASVLVGKRELAARGGASRRACPPRCVRA